ncbi:MAG: paaF 1 [Hyphomicrobiales bacterium]|jgi:enoyl-CoA hydratase|nr:paaF 1 [Hyphomicrobiales bacterium]
MPVLCQKDGHVATITLSRPEARNAWADDFTSGLVDHLKNLEDDEDVWCVILTGDEAGGAFSAGADMKRTDTHVVNSTSDFIRNLPKRKNHPVTALAAFPKPIVAAVNGYAVGIGCILTYCCDLIVASDRAEWRLPQSRLGIVPAHGGSVRLARWVGKGTAMRLALGFPLKAEEALRVGLAQWLVPHDELMGQAMEIAQQIASQPPLTTRLVKESLNLGLEMPSADLAAHLDMYRFFALEATEDKKEGHAAAREKRKPHFKGR